MSNYDIQFRHPTREGAKAQAREQLEKCFANEPLQAVHRNDALLQLIDAYIDLSGDDSSTVISGSLSLGVGGDRKFDEKTGAVIEEAGIVLHRELYCGLKIALDTPREGEKSADEAAQQSGAEETTPDQAAAGEANA